MGDALGDQLFNDCAMSCSHGDLRMLWGHGGVQSQRETSAKQDVSR